MKLETYRCEFCGTEFPLVPIAFVCPECELKHFFLVDKRSCTNELFLADVKCPLEKSLNTKKRRGWFRKRGSQRQK